MKKNFLKPKIITIMAALSLALVLGVSGVNHSLNSKQVSLHKINNGIGICFQRVTQTFTALMIREIGSEYLTKDFRSMTSDCLNEVSNVLASLGATDAISKMTNNFKSDLHWFNLKIDKVNSLATNNKIDISQSNIARKYSDLEVLKTNLEESILGQAANAEKSKTTGTIGLVLGQIALLLSGIALFFQRGISKKTLSEIEAICSVKLDKGVVDHSIVQNVSTAFSHLNLTKTGEALNTYYTELRGQIESLENSLLQMNSVTKNEVFEIPLPMIQRETVQFNALFSNVLERVYEKAMAEEILIDTDLTDEFEIYSSQEALEQLLFSLVTYSMDSAMSVESDRRLTVQSKSLGGISYCKVKINNYTFSEMDLSILNGKESNSDTSVNLLLLRELISDANATLAVKNKQNSNNGTLDSEIEVVFERARKSTGINIEFNDSANVKVVKGSKNDIKEYFQQNLSE